MLKFTETLLRRWGGGGTRGGKQRLGKLQQQWNLYFSPRKLNEHWLRPGFHKYREMHPDISKTDIVKYVNDNEDPSSLYIQFKNGVMLDSQQQLIQTKPAPKLTNYSYHFNPALYQFNTIMYGCSRKKGHWAGTNGAHTWENTRSAFHLMKCQLIANKTPTESPRSIMKKAINECGPFFLPTKHKTKGHRGYSFIAAKSLNYRQRRSVVFRRIRKTIQTSRPAFGDVPTTIKHEFMNAANRRGTCWEQREVYHKTCIDNKAGLFE